jgi:hypothetical protein
MATRYFNRTNPEWITTAVNSFKMNHADGTVTLKVTARSKVEATTGFCANCVELQKELEDSHKEYQDLARISTEELKEKAERVEFWKAGCETLEARMEKEAADAAACIAIDKKEIAQLANLVNELQTNPKYFIGVDPAKMTATEAVEEAGRGDRHLDAVIEETPNEVLDEQKPIKINGVEVATQPTLDGSVIDECVNNEETCTSDNVIEEHSTCNGACDDCENECDKAEDQTDGE